MLVLLMPSIRIIEVLFFFVNSVSPYQFQRITLASCITPSCDLTGRSLCHNVALRGEANLRDTLIKLGRARERRENQREATGTICLCVRVCVHAGGAGQYTLFQL